MGNHAVTGAHQVRKWLWSRIKDLTYAGGAVFDPVSLKNQPMVPSQQVPELTNQDGPIIVYSYSMVPHIDDWYLDEERMSFTIYDHKEDRLRTLFHYIYNTLHRPDDVPREINDFLNSSGYSPFEFKSMNAVAATGPDTFDSEGGRAGAMVVIGYQFTVDSDDNGMRT